jgi:hypothetical protein
VFSGSRALRQGGMLRRTRCAAAILVLSAPAVQGCSSLDELVFGPEPGQGPAEAGAALLPDDTPFPSVATVPPRPRLSYSVQQERAIVDALISDRENARYTGDSIRYRAGRAERPPAEAPPTAAVVTGETVVGPVTVVAPDTTGAPVNADRPELTTEELRALERDQGQLDDGGLDDFVRDLVDETAPDPDLDTETAVIDQRYARASPVPGRKGTESAFQRLFYWLVGDPGEDVPEAAPDAGEATDADAAALAVPTGFTTAAPGPAERAITVAEAGSDGNPAPEAPERPAADEAADNPDSTTGRAQLPRLKPDESADPPPPAPVKPDDGGASAPASEGEIQARDAS